MPLSKKKNRDRMRIFRLHKLLSSLMESNPVQPNYTITPSIQIDDINDLFKDGSELDDDGNPIYEEA